MRRTSVLIEVDDDVYNGLVEPHKRNKTFSKLIASLLNGYISDSYIRAFVDDNLEEVRKAVVGSFEDSVGEMESVLASMGLYTDELGAHSASGYNRFQQKRAAQVQELEKDPLRGSSMPKTESAEVMELREKVTGLERTVTEGFNRILEMLGSNGTAPMSKVTVESKPSVLGVAEAIIAGKAETISAPTPVVPTTQKVVDEFDDSEEESDSGSDAAVSFLSSLTSDFGSF